MNKSSRKTKGRASHNKRLNNSNPMGSRESTETWSVVSSPTPGLNHVQVMDNKPYLIVQTGEYGTIATSSSTADVFYAQSFNVGALQNYANIATVFDQYQFVQIEAWLTPTYQNYVGGNPNSVYLSVIDYDDSIIPTSSAALLAYQNCIEVSSTTGTYRRWKPHSNLTNGGGQTIANMSGLWIDIAAPSAPQFGIKVALKASSVTTTLNMRVRYTIKFRNVF